MKTIAVVALMILASASAFPQYSGLEQRRDIEQVINDYIDRLIERLSERDPIEIDRVEGSYELPIPGIFSASGYVEGLSVTGLSNIVVNSVSHDAGSNKVYVDVAIPDLRARIASAQGQIQILGRPVRTGRLDGELAIVNFRIQAEATIGDGSVTSLTVSTSLGGIESGIHLNVAGYDLSGYINNFLSNTLPGVLGNNADRINEYLARAILYLLNRNN